MEVGGEVADPEIVRHRQQCGRGEEGGREQLEEWEGLEEPAVSNVRHKSQGQCFLRQSRLRDEEQHVRHQYLWQGRARGRFSLFAQGAGVAAVTHHDD